MPHRAAAISLLIFAAGMLVACVLTMLGRPNRMADHAATEPITLLIDPSTADADTLCLLPRIGPGIAQRIIDHRQNHGPFEDVEDLAHVSMIGDKTVAALRPWVRLTPTTEK